MTTGAGVDFVELITIEAYDPRRLLWTCARPSAPPRAAGSLVAMMLVAVGAASAAFSATLLAMFILAHG